MTGFVTVMASLITGALLGGTAAYFLLTNKQKKLVHQLQAEKAEAETKLNQQWQSAWEELKESSQAEIESLRSIGETAHRVQNAQDNRHHALLATLSHELRTPLNGILGMAQVMQASQATENEGLSAIEASAQQTLTVLSNLVNLSKAAGEISDYPEWISPADVVDKLQKRLRFRAKTRGLKIEAVGDPDIRIRTDREQMETSLENLILASLEETPVPKDELSHGTLNIGWAPNGRGITFQVKNPREIGETKICDPDTVFEQRTGNSHNRIPLQTILRCVSQAYSARRSGGVEFSFEEGTWTSRLVWGGETMGAKGSSKGASPFSLRKNNLAAMEHQLNLLVAEDDPLNQQVIQNMLMRLGHKSSLASNGEEAIELLLMGKFDAILMDIDMPVMDGMTATRHIRQGQGGALNRRIPIVATTAFASTSDQGKFLEAGMDYFLSKPLSSELLRHTLLTIAKKSSSPSSS